MKTADAFQIRDRVTGRFMNWEIVAPGGPRWDNPVAWGYVWHDDPQRGGAWTGEHVDRFLANPANLRRELDGIDMEKVPAPACGCCGKMPREIIGDRYQLALDRTQLEVGGEIYWRCEKHVGRNPCCVEGCGKTYALKGEEDYSWRIMCGRCWRQAPKWMRDRVTKIRKLARRRGWTGRIRRLHDMAWEACFRAIRDRRTADPGEALPSSGPPPAGMLDELARLGL